MYKGCGGDFVFNHAREMKTMLFVLCRNLAKSLFRIEIRMSREFSRTLTLENPWENNDCLTEGPYGCTTALVTKTSQKILYYCVLNTMRNEGLESGKHVMLPFSKTWKLRLGTLV